MTLSLTVVVPVRDGCDLIGSCLGAVVPQLGPQDELVVVDDGSTDDTIAIAMLAAPRARLIRSTGVGPYGARNLGATTSSGDGIVFLDARCVPRRGWLDDHRSLLQTGAALSYGDVVAIGEANVASQVVAAWQPFLASNYGSVRPQPYFPACNLGVSRLAFVRARGFQQVRSGADADLCWRVLNDGGAYALSEHQLVTWRPRKTVKELIRQYARYGKSSASLQVESGEVGIGRRLVLAPIRCAVAGVRASRDHTSLLLYLVGFIVQAAYEVQYLRTAVGAVLRRRSPDHGDGQPGGIDS